jgi:hypothetical protein
VLLTPAEQLRWLDNQRPIALNDAIFRSELKMPLRLQSLSRTVGNARNKDPAVLEGLGECIELAS